MNVLFTMGAWNPSCGGPYFSVGNLAQWLAQSGRDVSILSGSYTNLPAQEAPLGVEMCTLDGKIIPWLHQTYIPKLRSQLEKHLNAFQPHIIHDNGLWLTLNHHVANCAKQHGIPRVLSPRGTMDPWAVGYRCWKKRVALALYQRRDLERVDCFHATSILEVESIREFGMRQPIALIPNGVNMPENIAHFEQRSSNVNGFEESDGDMSASGCRVALYLGRIHPIKNLSNLIISWMTVKPKGWKLKIVGEDVESHRKELEKLVASLGGVQDIIFSDPVYEDAAKAKLLEGTQLLFLVSNSENFGLTVVEALAYGVPVVTSTGTPWKILQDNEIGWWVDPCVDALGNAISHATSLSADDLQDIGMRGRNFVQKHYSIEATSMSYSIVYQWLLGQGPRPDCVRVI